MTTALFLAAALAWADPVAARDPLAGDASIHVGTPESGAVAWLGESVGLAAGLRTDLGATEVMGTWRRSLTRPDRWGIDVHGAAGLGVGLVKPVPYISTVFGLHGRYRGERLGWSVGAVMPAAATVTGPTPIRVPILLESMLSLRIGHVAPGLRLATGAVITPGLPPSFAAQAGLGLTIWQGSDSP